ncbi:diguanylate cyclase [Vibrio sp. 1S139]|uniref:diguanylate cyclase n=1 Tax=Vibrio sp. 1S139 TaxID=3230006 RepID=UPI00352F5CF4
MDFTKLKKILKNHIRLRKRVDELTRVESKYKALLDNSDDYISFKDSKHKYIAVSRAFLELLGMSREEIIGKTDLDLFDKGHAEVYFKEEKRVIRQGQTLNNLEEIYRDHNGTLRWISTRKQPIYDENKNVIGLVGIGRDITKAKSIEQKLRRRANYDPLTNVCNRKHFIAQAELLLKNYAENNIDASVYFIDLDGFKAINDQYGHSAGDYLIQKVAERLKLIFYNNGVVGRFGGDEFVAIHRIREERDALRLAQAINTVISSPIIWGSQSLVVGCSVGVACFPKHSLNIEHLLIKADTDMYKSKLRNRPSLSGD